MRTGFGSPFAQQVRQQQQMRQQMGAGWWWTQQRKREQAARALQQNPGLPGREAAGPDAPGAIRGVRGAAFHPGTDAAGLRAEVPVTSARAPRRGFLRRAVRRLAQTALWAGLLLATAVAAEEMPPLAVALGAVAVVWFFRTVGRRTLMGEARQIQPGGESDALGQVAWVRFRLDRYDGAGNRLNPVAVEVRGASIRGSLQEGDWVEARGRRGLGGTFRPTRLRNLTTGERVRGRRRIGAAIGTAIGWTLLLCIVGGLIALVTAAGR